MKQTYGDQNFEHLTWLFPVWIRLILSINSGLEFKNKSNLFQDYSSEYQ